MMRRMFTLDVIIIVLTLITQHPYLAAQSPYVAPQSSLDMEFYIDRPGLDYRNFALPDARPDLCQQACGNETQCKAYTYVKPGLQGPQARCWLKSGVPNPVPNACCVSGALNVRVALPTTFLPMDVEVDRPG